MRFTNLFTVVAAGASFATATNLETTTVTSTTTRVLTLTECNPTVVDCPFRTTTSTQLEIETSTTSLYVPPTTTSVIEPPVVNTTTPSPTTIATSSIHTPTIKTTFYPAGNTSTAAGPTAPITRTSQLAVPGTDAPDTPGTPGTPGTPVPTTGAGSAPSAVPTAAANGLVASSGFLGAAVLAALVALY